MPAEGERGLPIEERRRVVVHRPSRVSQGWQTVTNLRSIGLGFVRIILAGRDDGGKDESDRRTTLTAETVLNRPFRRARFARFGGFDDGDGVALCARWLCRGRSTGRETSLR